MKQIYNYEKLLIEIQRLNTVLLYTTSPGCSVCHADYPKVEKIADAFNVPALHIDVKEVPEAAGQMNLFSSPTLILYFEGKEFHRQARIIDFDVLNYRIEQLKNNTVDTE